MVHETVTTLSAPEVLARAKAFFAERVPANAAFLEKQGPTWMVFRGQGGEEIALSVSAADGVTKVRGSTLMFDQAVGRFLSTLPAPAAVPA
ncbi:MAG TPA: hypothetical protein VG940_08720 [Gemmatimonadales bacterium]|nr:hypothetical protein [Gemmatimonadales bacterium]